MSEQGKTAYAKIIGPGWQYYMTKPMITLGRGGKGVDCDVKLSDQNAVSRQHFCVRFTPDNDGVEVENMSKNGIIVNGNFIQRLKQPVLIKSHTEVAYGRPENMRLTVILPSVSDRVIAKKRLQQQANNEKTHFPLIDLVGHALATTTTGAYPLTMDELITTLRKYHTQLRPPRMKESHLRNSVRHVITHNEHVFDVVLSEVYGASMKQPRYRVNESYQQRFSQFSLLLQHAKEQAEKQKEAHKKQGQRQKQRQKPKQNTRPNASGDNNNLKTTNSNAVTKPAQPTTASAPTSAQPAGSDNDIIFIDNEPDPVGGGGGGGGSNNAGDVSGRDGNNIYRFDDDEDEEVFDVIINKPDQSTEPL